LFCQYSKGGIFFSFTGILVQVADDLILTPNSERECLRISELSSVRLSRIRTENNDLIGVILIVSGLLVPFGFLLIAWGAGCLYTKGYVYRVVVERMGEDIELYRGAKKGAMTLLKQIQANVQVN